MILALSYRELALRTRSAKKDKDLRKMVNPNGQVMVNCFSLITNPKSTRPCSAEASRPLAPGRPEIISATYQSDEKERTPNMKWQKHAFAVIALATREKQSTRSMGTLGRLLSAVAFMALCFSFADMAIAQKALKPNIVVIWGDDIGMWNVGAYTHGMMGRTPNIDSIAKNGILFTDHYGQPSCTAGRAAFITGQMPIRTGMTTIGIPGSTRGIQKSDPTLAEALKTQGYATGQFGKNHLGDRNEFLPTVHGFDEWFGNLYHLNAEEEPEEYKMGDTTYKVHLDGYNNLDLWTGKT